MSGDDCDETYLVEKSYGQFLVSFQKSEEEKKKKEEERRKKHADFLETEKNKTSQARLKAWYTINLRVRGMDMDTEDPVEKVREGLKVYGDVMNHSLNIRWLTEKEFIVYGFKIRRFENDDRGSLSGIILDRFFSDRDIHCFYTVDKDNTQTTKRVCSVTAYKEDTKYTHYVYELMEALEKAEAKYDQLQSRYDKLQSCVPSWHTEESRNTDATPLPPRPPKVTRDVCYLGR
jgi:hypothetical protein